MKRLLFWSFTGCLIGLCALAYGKARCTSNGGWFQINGAWYECTIAVPVDGPVRRA